MMIDWRWRARLVGHRGQRVKRLMDRTEGRVMMTPQPQSSTPELKDPRTYSRVGRREIGLLQTQNLKFPCTHTGIDGRVMIPSILDPTPYTLHPTPYTLKPQPFTLKPLPFTLNPKLGYIRQRAPARRGIRDGQDPSRTPGGTPNQAPKFSPLPLHMGFSQHAMRSPTLPANAKIFQP
jgi:hypothetical protein